MLIWGKLIHVLKTDNGILFKDLLTNNICSKQILYWNFEMNLYLNREIVWEFLNWIYDNS